MQSDVQLEGNPLVRTGGRRRPTSSGNSENIVGENLSTDSCVASSTQQSESRGIRSLMASNLESVNFLTISWREAHPRNGLLLAPR